jgi:hypothetical protein
MGVLKDYFPVNENNTLFNGRIGGFFILEHWK